MYKGQSNISQKAQKSVRCLKNDVIAIPFCKLWTELSLICEQTPVQIQQYRPLIKSIEVVPVSVFLTLNEDFQ